jgi:hypothetical protein
VVYHNSKHGWIHPSYWEVMGGANLYLDILAIYSLDETSGTRVDSRSGLDLTDVNTVGYAEGVF